MLEVLARDLGGRITRWTRGDITLDSPGIIFLDTEHFPAPGFAPLTMEGVEGGQVIRDREGSAGPVFRGGTLFPLSHLRETEEYQLIPGEGSVTVRSPPELIPTQLDADGILRLDGALELRRDPRALAGSVVRLRQAVGHSRLIYAPGIMEVDNLALLCYLGIDLFDSSLLILHSARRKLLLPDRTIAADEATWLMEDPTPTDILGFNLRSAWNELHQVRWAISRGVLREMVETRVTSDPWAVAVLRILDLECYQYQEVTAPLVGNRVTCNTPQSLHRPDVERWRRRIVQRYLPPPTKKVLLLLPCSARKPYSASRTHRALRRVIDSVRCHAVHEVIVTSPLGVVPRELELFYPASHYDIPVTGHWDLFEKEMILDMVGRLISSGYRRVICHLDEGFLVDGIDCVLSARGSPISSFSLEGLRETLEEACESMDPISRKEDRRMNMGSVARFQFGPGGEDLVEGTEIRGRCPWLRIMDGEIQLGMVTPERGMISLTLDGARRLSRSGINLVQIGEFELRGNLFAVGVVEADPELRKGDEAIVMRGRELVGVGVASMSGPEMVELNRGEAVRIRHLV